MAGSTHWLCLSLRAGEVLVNQASLSGEREEVRKKVAPAGFQMPGARAFTHGARAQRDPLPDDEIELPSELALGEDEDTFLASIKPEARKRKSEQALQHAPTRCATRYLP